MEKFIILECSFEGKRFKIEEDRPEIVWYIYVFDSKGKCVADYLQNDLESAKSFAFEELRVPKISGFL